MLTDRAPKSRWPRSQRFALSAKGVEAEAAYRASVAAVTGVGGRAGFDAARAAWASGLSVQPDDGAYLGELRPGAQSLNQVVEALETCGKTRADALFALGRLVDAGLVDAPPT